MTVLNIRALVQKLNPACQRSLEEVVASCFSRSYFTVEISHLLLGLMKINEGDLSLVLPYYKININELTEELHNLLLPLKRGNAQAPTLSQWVIDWIREAWLLTSLESDQLQIRSGYLLYALINSQHLNQMIVGPSLQLKKISAAELLLQLPTIFNKSSEAVQAKSEVHGPNTQLPLVPSETPALDQFTINRTDQAQKGIFDEVIGRDGEIRQLIDILLRRRQSNPILTGEPGVGKTALVEGLALRITRKEVPEVLRNSTIRSLDLGLLQAGTGVKGEFEHRLKNVLKEVKNSPSPVILFIDEAHTLVGTGGLNGQNDAANLLKPALARGELKTIAATTWVEYKKYFETDAALSRRFQVIKVEEPNEKNAILMVRAIVAAMEKHHRVQILDEAIVAAVRLSNRYVTGRQLPDKAISVLDTACSRLAMHSSMVPASLELVTKKLDAVILEIKLLEEETLLGRDHRSELKELIRKKQQLQEEGRSLQFRFEEVKKLIDQINLIKTQLKSLPISTDVKLQSRKLQKDLRRLVTELQGVQGEQFFIQDCVSAQSIAEVISSWTGIPLGRMQLSDRTLLLELQQRLEERVIGQTSAIKAISERIKMAKFQLTDPQKPLGIFLFIGPSGVGKTETAHAIAEQLYGGEQNLTVINLSEFKEAHKVSLLLGAPPGYVGYGQGGILTEAVRQRPYSLLLFDEVEKAHCGIHDIFYQIFDKGIIQDSEGRTINFKNTLIILTSNIAEDHLLQLTSDSKLIQDNERLLKLLKPELLKVFKPAFLGRVTIIPYSALDAEKLKCILKAKLEKIKMRILNNYNCELMISKEVMDYIVSQSTSYDEGARTLDRLINTKILPELTLSFLNGIIDNNKSKKIEIKLDKMGGEIKVDFHI